MEWHRHVVWSLQLGGRSVKLWWVSRSHQGLLPSGDLGAKVDKKEDRLLLSLNLEKGRSAAEIAEAGFTGKV